MSNTITVLDQEQRDQAQNPTNSCIVQAPAGSGKTTLLAQRYVALLANVEQPEQILAITFTKKAAAEMRQRVLQELANVDSPIGAKAVAHATAQNWQLHKYPSRLRIQTIDAFAMSLVKQLPITSKLQQRDISAHPDENYQRAVARVLRRVGEATSDSEQNSITTALLRDFLGNTAQVHNLLVTMLRRREQWQFMLMERLATFDNNRLIDAIAEGIQGLQHEALENLKRAISLPTRHSLNSFAAYASDMLGEATRFAELAEVEQWRFIAERLVLTAGAKLGAPVVRRRLTKNEGFPPSKDNSNKEDLLQLLAQFREDSRFTPMLEALVAVRELPRLESAELDRERLSMIGVVLFECVTELTQLFTERGEVDYNQITIAAITALGTEDAPTELALSLDYRISHLLIDEFQDTSRAQHELFSRLIREWTPDDGNSFFAVGDPMQSIYRFRNAEVSLFLDVCENGMDNLPLQHLRLTTNFRSSNRMIGWFNNVFASVLGDSDDRNLGAISYAAATSPRGTLEPLDREALFAPMQLSATQAEQHEQLVAHIKLLAATDGWTDIAILVRNRTPVGKLVQALEAADIPWQGTDLHALGNTAIVSDLVCLAEALFDPGNRVSMFALLRSPLVGLTLNDLHACTQALAEAEQPEHADEMRYTQSPVFALPEALVLTHLSTEGSLRLARLQQIAQPILQRRLTLAPRELLETLWLQLGGPAAYPTRTLKHANRLLDVIELGHPRRLDTQRLRRDVQALYAEDDGSGVQILTVHKSKGLQYKHVLLPAMDAGSRGDDAQLLMMRDSSHGMLMACKAAGSSPYTDKKQRSLYNWLKLEDAERSHNETRRLLYVAATRAEESLTLFATLPSDKTPKANSLLATLERVYGELWQGRDTNAAEDQLVDTKVTQPGITIKTLPGNLNAPQLQGPTITLPRRARGATNRRAGPDLDSPELLFAAERRAAILRGNLIHQALCTLTRELGEQTAVNEDARRAATTALIDAEQFMWLQHTLDAGIADALATQVVADTATGLTRIAASTLGQWCALAPQSDSQAELPLTLWEGAGPMKLVVDRTFVVANTRWIIDYKTALPPKPEQESAVEPSTPVEVADGAHQHWLTLELERYSKQLGGYARALAAMHPNQQMRTALYFTAIDELWELLPAESTTRPDSTTKLLELPNGLGAQQHTSAELLARSS